MYDVTQKKNKNDKHSMRTQCEIIEDFFYSYNTTPRGNFELLSFYLVFGCACLTY